MKKIELTTIIGIAAGVIAVIFAMIFKHISFKVFLNPAAIFVIFVGTIASVLNSFPGRDLKNLGKLFKIIFMADDPDQSVKAANFILEMAAIVRRSGPIALDGVLHTIEDPFMRKGFQLVTDGNDADYIFDFLLCDMSEMKERHSINASIFSSAGSYAPTLGVLGAVFGLISAMSNIEDIQMMAAAISAAFIATILGIFTGYVLWNPFATKLKVKSKHELQTKRLITEGIVLVRKGESPQLILDKFKTMIPLKQHHLLTLSGARKEE